MHYMMKMNKGFTIYDDETKKVEVHDTHPSKKCHEVIAKNIIDFINKENTKLI